MASVVTACGPRAASAHSGLPYHRRLEKYVLHSVHAVWSYKEQCRILDTRLSLKFLFFEYSSSLAIENMILVHLKVPKADKCQTKCAILTFFSIFVPYCL